MRLVTPTYTFYGTREFLSLKRKLCEHLANHSVGMEYSHLYKQRELFMAPSTFSNTNNLTFLHTAVPT